VTEVWRTLLATFELSDTDPQAREVQLALLRKMAPEQRLALALELTDFALRVSEAGVRQMYPDAGEREVLLRAAARRLTREQMIGAYGWDPESDEQPG
jgi:hypothetical protein